MSLVDTVKLRAEICRLRVHYPSEMSLHVLDQREQFIAVEEAREEEEEEEGDGPFGPCEKCDGQGCDAMAELEAHHEEV